MGFDKKYTENDIIKALKSTPTGLMLARIQEVMGCSEMTARTLLKPLIDSGKVKKTNIGASKKKAINLYILKEEI